MRQTVAEHYSEQLKHCRTLRTPTVPKDIQSAWAQYSILVKEEELRNTLQARLKDSGIPTAIYYPKPLHLQTAFASLGYRAGDLPRSEDYAQRIFSLPMHPYLTAEEQDKIASLLKD